MSSNAIKTVIVKDDKFVNKENQEIPKGSIIHCLGSLFKITYSELSHVVGKIDDNTYFADPQIFRKLNELAFSDQAEVTSTPEVAPQKESLLASVYRLMTAPFTIRTPKNITTRTRKLANFSSSRYFPCSSTQVYIRRYDKESCIIITRHKR